MKWLTAKEIAYEVGVEQTSVYHYQHKLGFEKKYVGGRVFYPESCVKDILGFRAVHGRVKNRKSTAKKVVKPVVKSTEFTHCPICGRELLDLERGEKRCRECDKYFKGGREIMYNSEGSVVFLE